MSTTNERYKLNKELAQMLKGGVIMDVTTPEQAKIAEAAGACAVMALERIPADIRAAGGVSRMSDPKMIEGIQNAVSIPVMAKCRIGHFVEAQVLEAIEIDYIDESEVLSPARIRATTSSRTPTGYFFIPFFPDILRPPNVVLFSYIRGPFVYCPFLLGKFRQHGAFFARLSGDRGKCSPGLEKAGTGKGHSTDPGGANPGGV